MSFLSQVARHRLLAAGAVLVLSGSVVGVAAAQQAPAPAPGTQQQRPGYQQFLDALARRLGVTPDRLQQAITETRTELGMPDRGRGFPFGGPGGQGGQGAPGGPGERGRGGPGGLGQFGFGAELDAVAQAAGVTVDQLRQELPGKSLVQVAQAHGKSATDVTNALTNAFNQRIDQAVANGRLSADQANQVKQQFSQRVNELANMVVPQGLFGGRGPGGQGVPGVPGGPGAPGGFGPGGPGGARRGIDAAAAAQAIGITVDQLRQEVVGETPAQVAQAHGKNPADVATALKNAANQRIDQAVANGRLTADQANQLKQRTATEIDQSMNEVRQAPNQPRPNA